MAMVIWPQITGFLLVGYLAWARSFGYLGVPPLFVGEIGLAAFLVLKPRVALGTWAASLLSRSPLNEFGVALFIFMMYGVWQVARGVFNGSDLLYAMKFFVFNYYTLYIFLGMWIGLHAPDCLRRLIRVTGWVNGIYGIIFLLALRHVGAHMPGSDVRLFSAPAGQTIVILGLLCFERDLRSVWFILMLNILVTLAWQVRAEWLGLVLGLLAWGLLTGRLHRVVVMGMAALTVLGMIEFLDINLVSRTGGAVSLSETLGRFIAPINLELAKAIEPTAGRHVGTAEWRELWWKQIWISAHSTPMLEAFGHGYGFDLFGLAPPEVRSGQEDWDVRTPHSVFYYALGYTGWVGVVLFSLLQFTILRLLWRSFRVTRQPVGLVLWVLEMGMAFFEASFETPLKAIPFYLLVGMAIAPALQQTSTSYARTGRAHALRPQFAQLRAQIGVAAGRNPGALVLRPAVGRGDLGDEWPRGRAS